MKVRNFARAASSTTCTNGTKRRGLSRVHLELLVLFVLSGALLLAAPMASAANPSANLDQCANDPVPSPSRDGCNSSANQWVNGNLGASKSVYFEGDSIPYRLDVRQPLDHRVAHGHDRVGHDEEPKHAIDYLDDVQPERGEREPVSRRRGLQPGSFTTFAIPADPQVTRRRRDADRGQLQRCTAATITSVSAYSYSNGAGFIGDKSAQPSRSPSRRAGRIRCSPGAATSRPGRTGAPATRRSRSPARRTTRG